MAAIMEHVAANQDRAEAERARYTYVQHADVVTRKGHKILCREVTDSRVTPSDGASSQELLTLTGTLWFKNRYVSYTHLVKSQGRENGDPALDVDFVENLRKNLTDSKSKDGFAAGLFPLTGKAQADYDFKLIARESKNGHDTWHLQFRPRDTSDFNWAGDAWIDTSAFEPVLVQTHLSRPVPFLVKTMLGTNVPGLGFAVTYEPQSDGTWFPVTFGTEFKVHVLFFFKREVVFSAQNRDFQKTHSEARILDSTPAE